VKTAVVTGASGFLGRHWVPFLEARGVRVAPFRRDAPDMSDAAALGRALRDASPDVVFHLAGVAETQDVSAYYLVNTVFAASLFASMDRAGLADRLVVLMGTSAEYGPAAGDGAALDEDAPCRPQSHYGISKLAQTLMGQAMARTGRRVLVVRPSNLIGPGMPAHMAVEQFAEQIRQATRGGQRTIATGDLSVVRDFIDVDDLCVRLWALCEAEVPSGEIVNVASGRGVAMREVVERLAALAGGGIEIRTDPARLRANDLRAHVSSTAKLERLVHPPPMTPLDDTLRRVLAWQPDTIARP
jgi:GDP-4-dehydro-6-deoxy-D-mannose reductase